MNGHKDVCIKAGSFCPVCKGMGAVDCWHEASEFQSGSFRFDRIERQRDDLAAALTAMVDEQVDYMTRNNLGDPEQQHTVKQARAALAKARGAS